MEVVDELSLVALGLKGGHDGVEALLIIGVGDDVYAIPRLVAHHIRVELERRLFHDPGETLPETKHIKQEKKTTKTTKRSEGCRYTQFIDTVLYTHMLEHCARFPHCRMQKHNFTITIKKIYIFGFSTPIFV